MLLHRSSSSPRSQPPHLSPGFRALTLVIRFNPHPHLPQVVGELDCNGGQFTALLSKQGFCFWFFASLFFTYLSSFHLALTLPTSPSVLTQYRNILLRIFYFFLVFEDVCVCVCRMLSAYRKKNKKQTRCFVLFSKCQGTRSHSPLNWVFPHT